MIMTIQALPASTVRIIGSSQVLTDPASVVKELIDNALDACSTAIFVEISTNTLDVIQVRDNGHGVAPEDRDLVCRRYCTSKISNYEDLKDVGALWLGFRGEALASAAELSGSMILTTKVEGERVAAALKIGRNAEVEARDRASHPVGTTVRLCDLFKNLPVRKQTALKASVKNLTKMKRVLQTYALARPSTRFSLKVLKAKHNKGDWMYAPKPNSGVEDAAFKVVGKDCAGQCEWAIAELHGFEVKVFLPRPDADCAKISNVGHFISVDARPVSATRGTFKQMTQIFKKKLRASSAGLANAKDPFIWLNILCPSRSYDPNIEPAKDDVMFDDSSKVLEAFETLLNEHYPAIERVQEDTAGETVRIYEDQMDNIVERPTKRARTSYSNMYGSDDIVETLLDEGQGSAMEEQEAEEAGAGLQDVHVSNPWVLAKMHSSTKPQRTGSIRNGQLLTPLQERESSNLNPKLVTEPVGFPPQPPWNLSAPHPSDSAGRVIRDQDIGEQQAEDETSVSRRSQELDLISDDGADSIHDDTEDNLVTRRQNTLGARNTTGDFVSARQLPLGTPFPPDVEVSSHTFPDTRQPQARRSQDGRRQYLRAAAAAAVGIKKPFGPSMQDETRVWFDHLPQRTSASPPNQHIRKKHQDIDVRGALAAAGALEHSRPQRRVRPRSCTDAFDAEAEAELDRFESADSNQTLQQRRLDDFLPRNGCRDPCVRASNYVSDSELEAPNQVDEPSIASQEPHPSQPPTRATSRHERAQSRTARLPLETVPPGQRIHSLVTRLSTSISDLTVLSLNVQTFDKRDAIWGLDAGLELSVGEGWEDYATESKKSGLVWPLIQAEDMQRWKKQLEEYIEGRKMIVEENKEEMEEDGEIRGFYLQEALRAHAEMFAT